MKQDNNRHAAVFVYGSLREGFGNHEYYLSNATRIDGTYVLDGARMYSFGAFPGVVLGGSATVKGEVYLVNSDELEALDRLEGVPYMYVRKVCRVRCGGSARNVFVYLYARDCSGCPLVPSGDWADRRTRYVETDDDDAFGAREYWSDDDALLLESDDSEDERTDEDLWEYEDELEFWGRSDDDDDEDEAREIAVTEMREILRALDEGDRRRAARDDSGDFFGFYFAYGSNVCAEQMRRRCPQAEFVSIASLPNYKLGFVGHSANWNGGVATVREDCAHRTVGVVYALTKGCVRALDAAEGWPFVYGRKQLQVKQPCGTVRTVWTYYHRSGEDAVPSVRYATHIKRALENNELPTDVIDRAIAQGKAAVARAERKRRERAKSRAADDACEKHTGACTRKQQPLAFDRRKFNYGYGRK